MREAEPRGLVEIFAAKFIDGELAVGCASFVQSESSPERVVRIAQWTLAINWRHRHRLGDAINYAFFSGSIRREKLLSGRSNWSPSL